MPQCCRRCMPGTEMTLPQAQEDFAAILARLSPAKVPQFFAWIKDGLGAAGGGLDVQGDDNLADKQLYMIRKEIKQLVPVESCFKHSRLDSHSQMNGNGHGSTSRHSSIYDENVTVHVDDFLYDDDEVDDLVKEGRIQRYYCGRCGSKDVQSLVFVTHSLSISQLKYIFTYLLPKLGIQVDAKILVDIGSKYGGAVFAATLFCPRIGDAIGIEADKGQCDVTSQIIDSHNFWNKINVIHDDFKSQKKVLAKADLVVVNSAFSVAASTDADKVKGWRKLRDCLKPQTVLVHSPSLWKAVEGLDLGFEIQEWLEQLDTRKLPREYTRDNVSARTAVGDIEVWRVRS